jgi:hypothetical protein
MVQKIFKNGLFFYVTPEDTIPALPPWPPKPPGPPFHFSSAGWAGSCDIHFIYLRMKGSIFRSGFSLLIFQGIVSG